MPNQTDNWVFINTAFGIEIMVQYNGVQYYEINRELRSTASLLLPLLDKTLCKASVCIDKMDLLGVCLGPGSFTGLRIGIGTVKAFAQIFDLPIVGVSSLKLNAYNIKENGSILSIVAENNVCFVAAYNANNTIYQPQCIPRQDLPSLVQQLRTTHIVSNCQYADIQETTLDRDRIFRAMSNYTEVYNFDTVQPLYIRKPQPLREVGDV